MTFPFLHFGFVYPCMDCGTAGTAAGIDPKILDNWQSDTAFSIASWEHGGYDQQFEWDTSPDSNQDEAEVVDLGVLHGSLADDQPSASVFGHNSDPRLAQDLLFRRDGCNRSS